MKAKAIRSVKECFENDSVIITKILQGRGTVRIDARTRFLVADKDNFFSNWVTEKYVNRLSMDRYGKKVSELNSYILH